MAYVGLAVIAIIIWLGIGLASMFILGICADRGPAYSAEGRYLRKQKRDLEKSGYTLRTIFLFPFSALIAGVGLVIGSFLLVLLLKCASLMF